MQKVKFKNKIGKNIVGDFYPGPMKVPVIICPGFGVTKELYSEIDKIIKIINKTGYPVLSIDYTGIGESDPEVFSIKTATNDLKSTISFLKNKNYKEFFIIGFSIGGTISLKAYEDSIKTIILISSPTKSMEHIWSKWYAKSLLITLKLKGKIKIPNKNKKYMKQFTISKDLLEESKNLNQKEILEKINCPVLLLHGDADETVPLEQSVLAINYLNEESELVILKGAKHNCKTHIDEISDITVDWLNKLTIKLIL